MARKRVRRQKNDVDQQNQRSHAHSKLSVEKKRLNRVPPQKNQEQHRQIQEIPVQILQNERKLRLTLIIPRPLVNRTRGRILKKRAIVCFAVVVASSAKAQRPAQNQ